VTELLGDAGAGSPPMLFEALLERRPAR
jgi:hypothetical protein